MGLPLKELLGGIARAAWPRSPLLIKNGDKKPETRRPEPPSLSKLPNDSARGCQEKARLGKEAQDNGRQDKGPRDKGPRDKGPRNTGPRNKGPRNKGPQDKGGPWQGRLSGPAALPGPVRSDSLQSSPQPHSSSLEMSRISFQLMIPPLSVWLSGSLKTVTVPSLLTISNWPRLASFPPVMT